MCQDYQCMMLRGHGQGHGHGQGRGPGYLCMNCNIWKDILRPRPVRLTIPNQINQVVPKKDSWADMVEMDKSLSPYSPSYFNTMTKCFC